MALSEKKRITNDRYFASHYDRISVGYPKEFVARVKGEAKRKGLSIAGYVREALEAYLREDEKNSGEG